MVVFTCNHCGESLQKPRVEKHYSFQCRKPKSLTCVDCFKDFKNEEYTVHTKCITEEERYAAKGAFPGGIVKKGDLKQESWLDMIKNIVEKEENNLRPSLAHLFNLISSYSNVPRKKAKFINFIKSSTGGRVGFSDIESAWDLIEKYKSEQSQEKNENGKIDTKQNGKENDSVEEKQIKEVPNGKAADEVKNGTKRKNKDNEIVAKKKKTLESSLDRFSFKETILQLLNSKGNMTCNKLQKKVLKAYVKETGNEVTEKTIKKYNIKLKKTPDVNIKDDVVYLISFEQ